MAYTLLLEASPRNKATAATVAVRIAGFGSRAYTHKGHNDWRGTLVDKPNFSTSIDFDQNGFSGGSSPNYAPIRIASDDKAYLETLAAYHWLDADVVLSSGDDASPSPTWAIETVGRVKAATMRGGMLQLTIVDRTAEADVPVLNRRFAGTGTIEGDSDATGRICRRTWGNAFNVEGFPLVAASNIYEFGDLTKPLESMAVVRDKGRDASGYVDIAWAGSVSATYAALAASSPPLGGCARAPSIACAKWWTTPSGPLTADLLGESAAYTPVKIAQAVLAARTALSISNVTAADALRFVSAGLHVESESETVGQAIDRLLRGVSMTWLAQPAGDIVVREITLSSPVETVRVEAVERVATFQPVRLRKVGYLRNHRVHSAAEISAALLADDGTPITTGPLDGTDGAPGADSYIWIAYADSFDGSINFTTGAPGGRVFIGISGNQTSPTESTNPADYTWSLYRGPALFGLVNFNGNTIVGPDFAQKIGGGSAWNGSAYSSEAFTNGAQITFTANDNTHNIFVGLNTDPTTDADFASIDYTFYLRGDGQLASRISGGSEIVHGPYAVGPQFPMQIIYDGKFVRWFHVGSLLRTEAVAPNLKLYFDTSFSEVGGRVNNIGFTSAGTTGDDGTDGDPGDTGDTVIPIYRRSGTAPATPTGNLTPSGWSTSKPADDGTPLWRSDGRILSSDGVTLIGAWSAPTIFEAQAINLAAQTIVIDSQNDTFGPIIRALDPSQAIAVTARIRVALTTGPRTQSITTEFRLVGAGSWTTLASGSETDASFVATGAVGTITNSTGVSQTYEIRATTVMSSPNGDVQLERSYFRA